MAKTITCFEVGLLLGNSWDAELGDGLHEDIKEHATFCPSCRSAVQETGVVREILRDLRYSDGPELASLATALLSLRMVGKRQASSEWGAVERHGSDTRGPMFTCARKVGVQAPEEVRVAACKKALEVGFALRADDPQRGLEVLEVGVELAEGLNSSSEDGGSSEDLRARAWALLGNARRIVSDFRGSAEALERAKQYLGNETASTQLVARVLELECLLLCELRRFEEAGLIADRLIEIRREDGDQHMLGDAIYRKSIVYLAACRHEEAIGCLRRAESLVSAEVDPRLGVCVKHNLAYALVHSGRLAEGRRLLPEVRVAHNAMFNSVDLIRLSWLEGQAAREEGELEFAEQCLRSVKARLVQKKLPMDIGLVNLDLCLVLLAQKRIAELKDLAAETVGVFRNLGVGRDALAALLLFKESVDAGKASIDILRRVYAVVQKSQSAARGEVL